MGIVKCVGMECLLGIEVFGCAVLPRETGECEVLNLGVYDVLNICRECDNPVEFVIVS